ncbi:MAG: hypothetical protein K0S07_273 [Chlamydiales bacterium]|jgi:hypothetical protein|nr:hypothetical protein [Chlamydiales bacterium]
MSSTKRFNGEQSFWLRPVASFLQEVVFGGVSLPRFQREMREKEKIKVEQTLADIKGGKFIALLKSLVTS